MKNAWSSVELLFCGNYGNILHHDNLFQNKNGFGLLMISRKIKLNLKVCWIEEKYVDLRSKTFAK